MLLNFYNNIFFKKRKDGIITLTPSQNNKMRIEKKKKKNREGGMLRKSRIAPVQTPQDTKQDNQQSFDHKLTLNVQI